MTCGRAARAALLAAWLLAPFPGGAQAPQADANAPAAAAPPALPDIGARAEETAARLRQLTESLSDEAAFTKIEARIDALNHRIAQRWIETGQLIARKPRRLALDSLSSSWTALRTEVEDASEQIDLRAQKREADLASVKKMRDSWTHALELARGADMPSSVLERAQATLAAIDATRPQIERRRARVLVLQDGVSRSTQACDDALAQIQGARREAIERIFTHHELPVWRVRDLLPDAGGLRQDLEARKDNLRIYVSTYRLGLLASAAIALALMVLLRRERSQIESWATRDELSAKAAQVLRTPDAAAILLAIVITRPLRPNPPVGLQQLALALGVLAAMSVLRPLLGVHLRRVAYGLVALFIVDLASQPLEATPALEQIASIAVKGLTAALLLRAAVLLRQPEVLATLSASLRSAVRAMLLVLALGCIAGAAASVLGYVDLAEFLGSGALFMIYVAFAAFAFRLAANALLAIAFTKGPLVRLRAISRHRADVERRLGRALDVLAVLIWIAAALTRFELLDPAFAAIRRFFDARLQLGALDLGVGSVLSFVAVVVGSYLTTRVVSFLLEEDVYSRMQLPRGVPYALSTLVRYGMLLAGFLLALATLGLDLTRLTVLVSALSLGIGFGLQQIVNNFVSGLILLFERPVQVGDSVQLGDLSGEITRIGIRSSTVRTPEGAEVLVPNSRIIEEKVTNWTLSDRRRRVDLEISVATGDESERILVLLVDIARRDPRVIARPEPEALLIRFGEDSADFQLRVWTDEPHWMRLRSDLGIAVQRALRNAHAVAPEPAKG